MTKISKILLILSVCVLTGVTMISCDKEENSGIISIVGTWTNTIKTDSTDIVAVLEFNSDKTGSIVYTFSELNDSNEIVTRDSVEIFTYQKIKESSDYRNLQVEILDNDSVLSPNLRLNGLYSATISPTTLILKGDTTDYNQTFTSLIDNN